MYSTLFLTEYRVNLHSSTSTNQVPEVPSMSTQKMVLKYEYCTRVLHHCSRPKFLETLIKNIMHNYCACKNNKTKGVMLWVCIVCLKEVLQIIKCEVYP